MRSSGVKLGKYLKNQAAWARRCAERATERADALPEGSDEWVEAVDDEFFYARLATYFEGQLEWYRERRAE